MIASKNLESPLAKLAEHFKNLRWLGLPREGMMLEVNPAFFGFPPSNSETIWLEDDSAAPKVFSPSGEREERFSSRGSWRPKPLNYVREDTCAEAAKPGSDSKDQKEIRGDVVDEPVMQEQTSAEQRSPATKETKDVMSGQSEAMETK